MVLLFYTQRLHFTGQRTNFYFLCLVWSFIYLILLYQINVPIYKILIEENLVLVTCMLLTFYSYWRLQKSNECVTSGGLLKLYQKSSDSISKLDREATTVLIPNSSKTNCEDSDAGDSEGVASHISQDTIDIDDGEYKLWLDSVIRPSNHRLYLVGCCFAVIALLIYSNLVITSVCHPIPVMQIFSVDILLPDDCAGVYDQYDTALNFTGGLHALLLAFFIAGKLVQHMLFITQTGGDLFMGHQYLMRHPERTNRKSCISNWKSFLCN